MDTLQKVEKLRKDGYSVGEACDEAGISMSAYYKQKKTGKKPRKYKKRTPAVEQLVIPDQTAELPFIVYGSPSELAEFARCYRG